MKKLLLFLMFLATPAYAIETAVVGTMWKQVGSVVSPADDVTSVTGVGGGVSEGTDVSFTSITLDNGTPTDPTIAFSNSSTGIVGTGNTVGFTINGDRIGFWDSSGLKGVPASGSPFILFNELPSGSNPVYSYFGDTTSGQGRTALGEPNIISQGTEVVRFHNKSTIFYPSGAGQVRIYDDGTLENTGGVVFGGMTTIIDTYSSPSNVYAILANASSSAFTITLPDTSTVPYGFQHRTKKIDDSNNVITVDGFGSQTIDHSLTKIIRAHNNAITMVSDGSNWEILQATSTGFYGDMHVHDNISTTTIQTQDSPHLVRQFSEEITFGMSFNSGSTGPISAFAEYSTVVSGTTQVTDDAHGLTSGDVITINGTTSYNGIFEATVIDAANYYIVDTFVADDATGNWVEGDYFEMDPGTSGIYMLSFHGYGKPDAGTNQDYEFEIFINTIPQENVEAKRRFANSSDIGTFGGGGLAILSDGDRISLGIFAESGIQNFTLTHLNIALHLIRSN